MTSIVMEKRENDKSRWRVLSKSLMELNEKNYAQLSNLVVTELRSLIQVDCESSKDIGLSVIYILYERALRELVTSSFPVSASIVDALSNTSDIYEVIQKLMKIHFQELLKKLEIISVLTCDDIGVVYLLLSIFQLDKVSGRSSALVSILDMILKKVVHYIQSVADLGDLDLLVILLYSLINYALHNGESNVELKVLLKFIRKILVAHGDSISAFTKVLAIDILEQFQDKNNYVELYSAIYKKIFHPEIFIIPGLSTHFDDLPYPANSTNPTIYNEKLEEVLSGPLVEKESVSRDVSSSSEEPIDLEEEMSRNDPDGQSNSEEDEKDDSKEKILKGMEVEDRSQAERDEKDEQVPWTLTSDESQPLNLKDQQPDSIVNSEERNTEGETGDTQSDGFKPSLKWSISQIQQEPVCEKNTEIISVPAKCIGRVVGFQGAIARKLEIESNAVIKICDEEEDVPERPTTSCLTAHKLITGCLGIPSQLPPEQVEEEKFKLSEAKVKRQTEGRKEKLQSIKISGSASEIQHASRLINDLITCIETIHIPLDFTVDEILDRYSGKLKTIEMLLNVFLEVEEQENLKVVLNISGDVQSCQDAKKLIFEELGSFRSQHGHLFTVPDDMMKVLKYEGGVGRMVETVQQITRARIMYLRGPKGYAVFISGYPDQVNRSLQIFQKTNSELLCCLSDSSDETVQTMLDTKSLCNFIIDSFGDRKRKDSLRPSLLRRESAPEEGKNRLMYTKKTLLELSLSDLCKEFPKNLAIDDPAVQGIILESCRPSDNTSRLITR